MPSFLIYLHSSFCLGCRAQTSCYTRDGNCHTERQAPNLSITHIPDTPALKARVKQRIILNISASFNLFAAEPERCCCLPSLICILPSVLASFPDSPHKLLHSFLSPPPSPSFSHYSLCHCLLTCPCFPDCHNPSSFPSFNHHKSFPPLLCLASPHQQLCQGPKLPEPAGFMTNLYKYSKKHGGL